MHANEAARIKLADEFAEGGAMDDTFPPYVQCHVDTRTFDAVDRFDANQIGLVAGPNGDAIEKRWGANTG